MKTIIVAAALLLSTAAHAATAQGPVELDSIYIKGNKEFPQILYILPWKEMKTKGHREQTLVLHSLFGDLFDPVSDEVLRDHRAQGLENNKR